MKFLAGGILVFFGIICFVLLSMGISAYNGLVSLRNQVDRAWANIDVILKERFDLIPKLISICEQFTQYERSTIDKILTARKSYGNAGTINDKIKASAEMSQVLKGVFAIGEAYPELKSSEQFLDIQKALVSMESEIADRRELYNESVTNFNTRCVQFPDMMFAGMLNYHPLSLFHVNPQETVSPELKFKLPA
jgi:LemA protein